MGRWMDVGFPPSFFFVGRAWLFQPFFFSLSPIIIFPLLPYYHHQHHYLHPLHLIVGWRPRHCNRAVAAGLPNNNNNNSSPPLNLLLLFFHFIVAIHPCFFLTSSPHQHYFPTSSTYNPFSVGRIRPFGASASIEVLQGWLAARTHRNASIIGALCCSGVDGTPLPVPTGRAGPRHEDALRRRGGIPTAPPHPYNPIFFLSGTFHIYFIIYFIYFLLA